MPELLIDELIKQADAEGLLGKDRDEWLMYSFVRGLCKAGWCVCKEDL